MATQDVRFESQDYADSGRLHRAASVGSELLITAQGDPENGAWVLGWVPAPLRWEQLLDLIGFAYFSSFREQHGLTLHAKSLRGLRGHYLYEGDFQTVREGRRLNPSELVQSFKTAINRSAAPSLLVLSNDSFQLEIIFQPDTLNPALLTLFTQDNISDYSYLVRATHKAAGLRERLQNRFSENRGVDFKKVIGELCSGLPRQQNNGVQLWDRESRY